MSPNFIYFLGLKQLTMTIKTSKISKKGLTTIPLEVKKALKAEDGDYLEWEVKEGYAIVRVAKNPYKLLRGRHRDPKLTFEKVEGIADKLIEAEVNAGNRV